MGDGSPLEPFLEIDADNWIINVFPHAKSQAGIHTIKLIAFNKDGTKLVDYLQLEIKTYLYPHFKEQVGPYDVQLHYRTVIDLP